MGKPLRKNPFDVTPPYGDMRFKVNRLNKRSLLWDYDEKAIQLEREIYEDTLQEAELSGTI